VWVSLLAGCAGGAPGGLPRAARATTAPAASALPARCEGVGAQVAAWGEQWPRQGENPGVGCPVSLEGAVSIWRDRPAAELTGRPVLVCFWGSYSEPSRKALIRLEGVAERHPDLAVVAIAVDGGNVDASTLRDFAAELGLEHADVRWLPDQTQRAAVLERFAAGDNTSYLIDAAGVMRWTGFYADMLEPSFEARLDDLRP